MIKLRTHIIYASTALVLGFSTLGTILYLKYQDSQTKKETLKAQEDKKLSNQYLLNQCLLDVDGRAETFANIDNSPVATDEAKLFLDEVQRQKENCRTTYPVQ